MGSGRSNLLKYFLLVDGRNGWYYAHRIVTALTMLFVFINVGDSNFGAKGYAFLYALFSFGTVVLTLISCSIFGSAVTEEKEQGILPLVMMTGISSQEYVSSKFLAKFAQVILLSSILIPPTLFAVTLGGVNTKQIVFLFSYLLIWLLLSGAISFWLSIFLSKTKEVLFLATPGVTLVALFMGYAGFFPIERIKIILNTPNISIFEFKEILFVLPAIVYLYFSSCKNLHFGILFPISFLDEYLDRVKANRLKLKYNPQVRIRRKVYYLKKFVIKAKDEAFIPVKPLMGDGLTNAEPLTVIIFIIALPFLLGLFMSWIFFGPFWLTWVRLIDVFKHEIEEKTFSSLLMLPMSREELLNEKITSAEQYVGVKIFYLLFVFPLFLMFLSIGNVHLIFLITLLPFLYKTIIYTTIIVVFRAKDMVKIICFGICALIFILYMAVPYLSIAFVIISHYLKKVCLREMELCGEISD